MAALPLCIYSSAGPPFPRVSGSRAGARQRTSERFGRV